MKLSSKLKLHDGDNNTYDLIFEGVRVQIDNWIKATTIKYPCDKYGLPNLTLKHLETHGCLLGVVATDALALNHQAITADQILIALELS